MWFRQKESRTDLVAEARNRKMGAMSYKSLKQYHKSKSKGDRWSRIEHHSRSIRTSRGSCLVKGCTEVDRGCHETKRRENRPESPLSVRLRDLRRVREELVLQVLNMRRQFGPLRCIQVTNQA